MFDIEAKCCSSCFVRAIIIIMMMVYQKHLRSRLGSFAWKVLEVLEAGDLWWSRLLAWTR